MKPEPIIVTDVHQGPLEISGPGLLLLDIDGTVADIQHRIHFLDKERNGGKKNFPAFEAAAHLDSPITAIIEIVLRMQETGWTIVAATGRNERIRLVTRDTLRSFGIRPVAIYMRRNGDYRPDVEVKRDMLDAIVEKFGKPTLAFEDRDRVVEMWRAQGIPTVQVAHGSY